MRSKLRFAISFVSAMLLNGYEVVDISAISSSSSFTYLTSPLHHLLLTLRHLFVIFYLNKNIPKKEICAKYFGGVQFNRTNPINRTLRRIWKTFWCRLRQLIFQICRRFLKNVSHILQEEKFYFVILFL